MMNPTRPEKVREMFEKISISSAFNSFSQAIVTLSPKESPSQRENTFLGPIKKWMAAEEKAVHSCVNKAKTPVVAKDEASAVKPLPIKPSGALKTKRRFTRNIFLWLVLPILVLLTFFYFQSNFFVPGFQPKFAPIPIAAHEEKILSPAIPEDDYQQLKALSLSQEETIRQLKKQIQVITQQVRSTQKKVKELQNREGDYRDELYQLALKHQEELWELEQINRTKTEQIRDLNSSLQETRAAIQKIKESQTPKVPAMVETSRFAPEPQVVLPKAGLAAKVVLVNSQYRFVVINAGAEQGVRTGQTAEFFLNGKKFASGTIEKVSFGLSGVAVFDHDALVKLQKEENVSVNLQ